jgi:glycine/D-amino acid oxidase-like deaminating enzyme
MTLDLRTVTAYEAITAMMTVEGLRCRAASLHTGDRIVYHRDGSYHVDTVASATGSWYPGLARSSDVTITTRSGDVWSCSHENRSTLRITAL